MIYLRFVLSNPNYKSGGFLKKWWGSPAFDSTSFRPVTQIRHVPRQITTSETGRTQRTNKNDRNYGCFHAQLGPKIGLWDLLPFVGDGQTGIKYLRNCPPHPAAAPGTCPISGGDQTAHFSPPSSVNPKLVTNLTNFTTHPRAIVEDDVAKTHYHPRTRKNRHQ